MRMIVSLQSGQVEGAHQDPLRIVLCTSQRSRLGYEKMNVCMVGDCATHSDLWQGISGDTGWASSSTFFWETHVRNASRLPQRKMGDRCTPLSY